MAITVFTGPPGSGKSHSLVKEVILPALMVGRRVLSNIDGLDPDAVRAYCLERISDAGRLGQLVTFHGDDATKPGFWPDEATPDTDTVVKGGDLIVFDEWGLYFRRRGKWPEGCNVEPFLRWHRHLTGPKGTATDIAIGTQLIMDIHGDVRGLVAKSYKYKKLTALGTDKQYTWQLYEGSTQTKGGYYRTGTGTYDKAIFPLYSSSSAAKEGTHVELRTNKKESVLSGWQAWAVMIGSPLLILGGLWMLYGLYAGDAEPISPDAQLAAGLQEPYQGQPGAPVPAVRPTAAPSPWRIVGQIEAERGTIVVVADQDGATRMLSPNGFNFEAGRAVSGTIDGLEVTAEDRLPVGGGESTMLSRALQ